MASVRDSRTRTYASRKDDDDAPEHVLSQGELLIKEMVKKQMETQTSLHEQLNHQKEFEKPVEFEPLTKHFSGKNTLQEFQESSLKVSRKEDLQSLGLNSEEIELVFDQEKGNDFLLSKHKNIDKSCIYAQLEGINTKIQEAQLKHSKNDNVFMVGYSGVSRHEKELGLAVKPDSTHTRLYQFALSCQPSTSDTRPPNHPIHQLKDIEEELFGHLRKKRRHKRSSRKKSILQEEETVMTLSSAVQSQTLTTKLIKDRTVRLQSSLWDVEHTDAVLHKKSRSKKVTESKVYSCKPEVLYTIRNNKIVPLKDVVSPGKCSVEENTSSGQPFVMSNVESGDSLVPCERLTVDQIKEIPRFLNYEKGSPSKVLFVKNLHRNAKEDDLVQLFKQFETPGEPRIVYRLMTGKMKGQAFITFNNRDRATEAIDAINGCILKGQPLVIQYGKSS